jgi:hypothetical protein
VRTEQSGGRAVVQPELRHATNLHAAGARPRTSPRVCGRLGDWCAGCSVVTVSVTAVVLHDRDCRWLRLVSRRNGALRLPRHRVAPQTGATAMICVCCMSRA